MCVGVVIEVDEISMILIQNSVELLDRGGVRPF